MTKRIIIQSAPPPPPINRRKDSLNFNIISCTKMSPPEPPPKPRASQTKRFSHLLRISLPTLNAAPLGRAASIREHLPPGHIEKKLMTIRNQFSAHGLKIIMSRLIKRGPTYCSVLGGGRTAVQIRLGKTWAHHGSQKNAQGQCTSAVS